MPVVQVGASNELPESEELDALYDRFLIRRHVSQVCPGGPLLGSTLQALDKGGYLMNGLVLPCGWNKQ
jgi:hypothetical protein